MNSRKIGTLGRLAQVLLSEVRESDLFTLDKEAKKPAGGSTHPIKILKSKDDMSRWFSKSSAASELQTVNEYLAYLLYKLFGLGVVNKAMLAVGDDGELRFVASSAKGKQIQHPSELKGTDFRKGLFVDAMIGHWDVVGNAPRYNVFVDPDTMTTMRIDTGGLDFRAQGGRKGKYFGPKVGEMSTFAGIGGDALSGESSAAAFKNMTDKELAEAARLFKAVRWSEIEALMSKVQSEVDDLEMPDLSRDTKTYLMQVKPILKERYNHVTEVIAGLKA
jgi:hypothetical protein